MLGRLALCGAAATALVTLLPVHSSAKGFFGASMHHAAAFHFHFNGHGHGRRFSHRGRGHRNDGDGYAYWPLGYQGAAFEPGVVPLAFPIYAGPRCVHSVETVIVPAELGGERAIRITRC